MLEPVRGEQPLRVELAQVQRGRRSAYAPAASSHEAGGQRLADLRVRMDLAQSRGVEVLVVAVEPQREGLPAGRGSDPGRRSRRPSPTRGRPCVPPRGGVQVREGALIRRIFASPYASGMRLPVPYLLVAGVVTAVVVGGGVVALGRDDDQPMPVEECVPRRRWRRTTPRACWSRAGRSATPSTTGRSPRRSTVMRRTRWHGRTAIPSTSATAWRTSPTSSAAATPRRTARSRRRGCSHLRSTPPAPQRLTKVAGKATGCEAGSGPAFGAPTLALTCTTKDGVVRASYRGLFGDAWLVCEVVRPAGAEWDVVDRAGRWCVGVLEAAGSRGAGSCRPLSFTLKSCVATGSHRSSATSCRHVTTSPAPPTLNSSRRPARRPRLRARLGRHRDRRAASPKGSVKQDRRQCGEEAGCRRCR